MTGEPPAIRGARADDEAAVASLLGAEDLEADFAPDEFVVAEDEGRVVACARLKPLPDGGHELASVAVAPERRDQGLGRRVVEAALAGAEGPVHALCLQPGFFQEVGFEPLEEVPPALEEKAERCCQGRDWVPMVRDGEDS